MIRYSTRFKSGSILLVTFLILFQIISGVVIKAIADDCESGCFVSHCIYGSYGGGLDCKWLADNNENPVSRCQNHAYTNDDSDFGKYCFPNKAATYYTRVSCGNLCIEPMSKGINCAEPDGNATYNGPVYMYTACGSYSDPWQQ